MGPTPCYSESICLHAKVLGLCLHSFFFWQVSFLALFFFNTERGVAIDMLLILNMYIWICGFNFKCESRVDYSHLIIQIVNIPF